MVPSVIRSGIAPLDERVGGLEHGGTYLVVGAPGPEKMVAALQFLHEGVRSGESCLLVTSAEAEEMLEVAEAWGFDLLGAWETGLLQIVGFKGDFELRAARSIAPEEVLEELDSLLLPDLSRIAFEPGSMLLSGGARGLLGSSFLTWAEGHPATVLATFSVDGGASRLPSSSEWLVHATTGLLLLEKREGGLYQIRLSTALPGSGGREETVTLELMSGRGLVKPESYPSRRGADRSGIDAGRLLLVSLGDGPSSDLETWVRGTFQADVVSDPFDAVAAIQKGTPYGGVLVFAPRRHVRDALRTCRSIRPLSRAAIVFASDDAVRATDRIQLLEVGADDCLSGGIDFRELGLRIRQAIETGARPMQEGPGVQADSVPGDAVQSDGGRVSRSTFVDEVTTRGSDPRFTFFCVLDVSAKQLDPETLERLLAEQVRADDGDIVSGNGSGCAVLLQGARQGQLGPFLSRLKDRLNKEADGDAGLEVVVLSHPSGANEIASFLGMSGEASA
jgi:CheY-like chemotaxis protein